ncbi:MAG: glucohydrolase, partial [Bacilli bacterium]|nr:glucohydrolase [Bacilli bacterium]
MVNKTHWWRDAVGYIIYPESFQDSNNDGVGDLPGITSRLDYLKDLGVNLLWICPVFDSPMDDNGYDVRDYYKINPLFGTNEDLKILLDEAHKRGIRICLDFVLNHTSDEHPWFQKALADPNSEERGFYH